jgi:hypothetical protein
MLWITDVIWKSDVLVEIAKLEVQPILYTYNELKDITNNFHVDNELGKGSFGVVYKVNILHIHFFSYASTISRCTISNQIFYCLHVMLSFVVQFLHVYWFLTSIFSKK